MKTRNFINLILLLLLASCDGCKKDDPKPLTELEKLPPPTQEGKNTFGCLVNGKAFVPATSIDAGAVYQLGFLNIYGARFKPFQTLSLNIYEGNNGTVSLSKYDLNKFPDSYAKASFQIDELSSCQYEPQNCISGTITLTKIDRIKYIVSGTFDFTTLSKGCDTLKITNGRFDIRYIP